MKLVLNQLNLVARDFEKTLAFYRALGLEIPAGFASPDGIRHSEVKTANGVTLELDNAALAALYNASWRRTEDGSRVLIGFSVETREAVDERWNALIAAGYEGRQQPYDTFWGARYAVVADPDGNDVGIMSPVDPARRQSRPSESPS